MADTLPVDATVNTSATTTPAVDDISVLDKVETTMDKKVWHFVTVGVIASLTVGFFLGRLTKK